MSNNFEDRSIDNYNNRTRKYYPTSSQDNLKNYSYSLSVYILLVVLLLVTIYVFYLLYCLYKVENGYIDPKYCPKQLSGYFVTPATYGTVKSNCGPQQSDLCQFQTDTLINSITQCNNLGSNCLQFTFDGKMMNVIDDQTIIAGDQHTNLYTKSQYLY
jgi:hypothetical protein